MNILVLEDEPLAADRMRALLQQVDPNHTVLAVLRSVEKTVAWLAENPQPDCVLSDIRLLDGLSFEAFTQHPLDCPVIFTTAYDEFSLRAFEVNSVDYLLKPIQLPALKAALEKADSRSTQPLISATDLDSLARMLQERTTPYKARFLVRLGQKIKSVPTKDISYFYTEDKVAFLVSTNRERFPVNQSLEELESLVDPARFFRVNRKFLITHEAVSTIIPHFKGRLKLELTPAIDQDLVVSSEKTPAFKAWLDT